MPRVAKKKINVVKKEKTVDPSIQRLLDELKTITTTKRAELIRPMVPIEEWIDSSYYVGDLVYTLYPKYKQHIKSIIDSERDESDYIDEIIMSCSIGTG